MLISRFFCRYLCPLGAAQALFSAFSLLPLKHGKSCGCCSACLEQCPVGIRFSSKDDAVSPECIRCMDCIGDCQVQKEGKIHLGTEKRNVPIKVYVSLMLLIFVAVWLGMPSLWAGNLSGANVLPDKLKDGTYQGEARGFAGKIITEVVISGGKLAGINIIEHHESKGWYEEVFTVLPKEMIKEQRLDVDGISGATKTSKGLIKSVENATKKGAVAKAEFSGN
jgi:uncharacterized protein with FMN-binding domain